MKRKSSSLSFPLTFHWNIHSFIHWFIQRAAIRQKIKLKERGCQYRHRVSFPNLIHFLLQATKLHSCRRGEWSGTLDWVIQGLKRHIVVVSFTGGRRCLLTAAVRTCHLYNAVWNSLSHCFSSWLGMNHLESFSASKYCIHTNNNNLYIEKDKRQSRTPTGHLQYHICNIYQINGFTNLRQIDR